MTVLYEIVKFNSPRFPTPNLIVVVNLFPPVCMCPLLWLLILLGLHLLFIHLRVLYTPLYD